MIRYLLPFLLLPLAACSDSDVGRLMEEYLWEKRVLLSFAPSLDHPQLQKQMQVYKQASQGYSERDLVRWVIVYDQMVSIDDAHKPQLATRPFYAYFDVAPNQFTTLLIGKDGTEKKRSTLALSHIELFDMIDAMPMRQHEVNNE